MSSPLTSGANIGLAGLSRVAVAVGWAPDSGGDIDASAFLCGSNDKVVSDGHFVFYNAAQSPDRSVTFLPQAGTSDDLRQQFDIDLARVEPSVEKIDLCLTIHDGQTRGLNFGALRTVLVRVLVLDLAGSSEIARYQVPVAGMKETAVILASVYRRGGQWKFRAIGQGFIGGLAPLATHYGVDVAGDPTPPPPPPRETPAAPPAPPPPPPPPPQKPVSLSKVTLEKRGQSVSLEKQRHEGFGEIRVNLNWNQRPQKRGLLGGLLGGAKGIDLDLGCMWELEDGAKGVIQALGNAWGNFNDAPFIRHAGDDRTGAMAEGETIRINGDRISQIKRILIYAFIYDGVANWAAADGVATVTVPGQPDIEVRLDNPASGEAMCAIALIENDRGKLKVTKEERYFRGHVETDKGYRWGLRWVAGSKD